jgi:Tfp pilus assembly protein PilE
MATKEASQTGFTVLIVLAILAAGGYWYYTNYIQNTTTAQMLSKL